VANKEATAAAEAAASLRSTPGKVLAVASKDAIIVSLGSKHGFKDGDKLNLYEAVEIKDEKGAVVFTEEKLVGEVTLQSVQEERSKAAYAGDLTIKAGWVVKAGTARLHFQDGRCTHEFASSEGLLVCAVAAPPYPGLHKSPIAGSYGAYRPDPREPIPGHPTGEERNRRTDWRQRFACRARIQLRKKRVSREARHSIFAEDRRIDDGRKIGKVDASTGSDHHQHRGAAGD
jgi:hypothetical protein